MGSGRRAEPPRWAEADAPLKRRQSIAHRPDRSRRPRSTAAGSNAIERFNLEPTNFVIEQYNRYYVLEKECVMGSARLAARHFTPIEPFTKSMLLAQHPVLPVPELAGRAAGPNPVKIASSTHETVWHWLCQCGTL